MRLIWILGDQLLPDHPLLSSPAKDRCVGMIESAPRAGHLHYHQQKLTLLYAAMRHHAASLKMSGHRVLYRRLTDGARQDGYPEVLKAWIQEHQITEIHLLDPNEYDTAQSLSALSKKLGISIQTHRSPQFLVPREDFAAWAKGKKHLLMEAHYRRLRAEKNILMTPKGQPEGGDWNLDDQNRRTFREFAKEKPKIPPLPTLEKDPVVRRPPPTWPNVSRIIPARPRISGFRPPGRAHANG